VGNITNDMTRLRGEIDALRGARGALMLELALGARDLAATVSAMRAGFDAAHTAMAKKTRRDRVLYVTEIKKRVSRMRKETAADLNGARNAWCGKRTNF
jgi:hypothetical protein